MPSSAELLSKFIDSFQKAVSGEMQAMRARLGPFEVAVVNGRALENEGDEKALLYAFKVLTPNEKLVLHTECSLRHESGESLVTIVGLEKDEVTLRCEQRIALQGNSFTLVIYPWFLYEKLQLALESLRGSGDFCVESALTLFGKIPPVVQDRAFLRGQYEALNDSQRRAVELCCRSNLTFVWGPPGTGKTHTLACIVTELLRQGLRVLLTSTTNAAVDQALAKMAECKDEGDGFLREAFEAGRIVRVGQCSGDTHGTSLREVAARLNANTHEKIKRLRERNYRAAGGLRQCAAILKKLSEQSDGEQLQLFGMGSSSGSLGPRDLENVFERRRIPAILALQKQKQERLVNRRMRRLERAGVLYEEKVRQAARELRGREGVAVEKAQAVLSTMTNVYISKLLADERFDVVVVEEAGMAILPTLFYCGALARAKTIMVGDPRQLPPIIQSRDAYVQRAMGRSIFDVTVPDPHGSDIVVMLNEQYRMHPAIGGLVSGLFYEGRLSNGISAQQRESIVKKQPFAEMPVVVVDMEGHARCAVHAGNSSRYSEESADVCVRLAKQAVADGVESVAVIAPYVEQARLIRRMLGSSSSRIECSTVHRFQGNERDVVIFDMVDAAPLAPGILLSSDHAGSQSRHLLNVSISRARGKLIIVSDAAYFQAMANGSFINDLLNAAIACGRRVGVGEANADIFKT